MCLDLFSDRNSVSLDKKISKEVCRWVQTATNSAEGSSAMDRMNDSVSEEPGEEIVDKSNDDEKNGKPTLEVEDKRIVMSQLCGTVVLVVALIIGIWDMNTRKVGENYPV